MSDPSFYNSAQTPLDHRLWPRLDLDVVINEELTLTTLDGSEDFLLSDLAAFAGTRATGRSRAEVTAAVRGNLRGLYNCRLFASAAIPLPGAIEQEPGLQPLQLSLRAGVLQTLTTANPLRFRVGVRDSGIRKHVIGRVESSLGWVNEPSQWDVNLTPRQGRWEAQVGALHYSRRFGTLQRQPWSTTPLVAETLIRLAKLQTGMRLHDPCCGTATLLIVAHQNTTGLRLSGTDHDPRTLSLASTNLQARPINADLGLANSTPFPASADSLDRVVSNLPFGKQVGSHLDNVKLYPAILNEIARTLARNGRAVMLTEDKKLLQQSLLRTKGLKLVKARVLRYSGATPTAYVITPTRR